MKQNSPNYDKGRGLYRPEAIIIHKTEGSFKSCINWFADPNSRVSAHYVIDLDGKTIQMVDENDTAWHAGVVAQPSWRRIKFGTNPNLYTIGIELAGFAKDDTPADQTLALSHLIVDIAQRWNIPIDDQYIVFHREIRATKSCPGDKLSKSLIIFYALTIQKILNN